MSSSDTPDNWAEQEASSITRCCGNYTDRNDEGKLVCRSCKKEVAFSTPVEDWMLSDKPPERILEECKWRGFSDGFRGMPAAAVSNYVQPQTSYFDGFAEGRQMLERIQKVAQEEYPDDSMGMNKVMQKAFTYYERMRRDLNES